MSKYPHCLLMALIAWDVQIHKSFLSFLPLTNVATFCISLIEACGQPRHTKSGILSVVLNPSKDSLIISEFMLITSVSLNVS